MIADKIKFIDTYLYILVGHKVLQSLVACGNALFDFTLSTIHSQIPSPVRLHLITVCLLQGDGSNRAITGHDFFQRYPTLHPFLLSQLGSAVAELEAGNAGHPSLYPVLALLARLRCACMTNPS